MNDFNAEWASWTETFNADQPVLTRTELLQLIARAGFNEIAAYDMLRIHERESLRPQPLVGGEIRGREKRD